MSVTQAVEISAKLYENRDAMRRLYGKKWPEKVKQYGEVLREAMVAGKCDNEISAVLWIQRAAGEPMPAMTAALLLAVAVEMVENTK